MPLLVFLICAGKNRKEYQKKKKTNLQNSRTGESSFADQGTSKRVLTNFFPCIFGVISQSQWQIHFLDHILECAFAAKSLPKLSLYFVTLAASLRSSETQNSAFTANRTQSPCDQKFHKPPIAPEWKQLQPFFSKLPTPNPQMNTTRARGKYRERSPSLCSLAHSLRYSECRAMSWNTSNQTSPFALLARIILRMQRFCPWSFYPFCPSSSNSQGLPCQLSVAQPRNRKQHQSKVHVSPTKLPFQASALFLRFPNISSLFWVDWHLHNFASPRRATTNFEPFRETHTLALCDEKSHPPNLTCPWNPNNKFSFVFHSKRDFKNKVLLCSHIRWRCGTNISLCPAAHAWHVQVPWRFCKNICEFLQNQLLNKETQRNTPSRARYWAPEILDSCHNTDGINPLKYT